MIKCAKALHKYYQVGIHLCIPTSHVEEACQAPSQSEVIWKPPIEGWYKINWTMSMDPLYKVGWLGVLVHDHARRVMAASMGQLMALPRGVHLGIGAMIQVLTFAVEMGFMDVVLEGPFIQFLRDVSSRS